ncbi:WS/DGAT/MGAT family O-acyltransferase [Mycobacterium talmoniae]|uniref:Diacylglycerol O-acyltransferase n=2 Tax=Mycobacterium talmoniae TaxID=1858794 RepID=A0A1S1NDI4_9MYCO|nr:MULTISPECIES: wax ester/triacylglycerol synthase family O-acyltransferase [Mycobacterium]OHV03735.1 diacylglycerol O-acyltransferase [Mycobacterium talmoniae]TDH50571.1 wax ester/triacylglycerol synthase family O-acyltransferase [Mycobacterium eburneum]
MTHLTTLDASFLQAEDSDRHVSLAIGGIAIIDGPAPDHGRLKTMLAERIGAIPRFNQVLRMRPFDVGAPQWVDAAGFDLSRHIRRVAVPAPGADGELFRVVADVMERRLDRAHPLWECWVIEGLTDNRWAILMKIHHCMADGVSATHILSRLCDPTGDNAIAAPGRAGRTAAAPPPGRRAVPELNPLAWADNAWRAAGAVTNAAARAMAGATEIATGLLRPAGGSSLTGPVTAMRRYRAVRVRLAEVETVSRKFDVTINDVVLAAITEGFRAVLLHRGEQPRTDSLRTLVPVSVRSAEAPDTPDNRISIMLPYLPVDLDDPVQQLRTVHTRLTRTKRSGQRQAGNMLVSAANVVPFMLSSWAIRLLTRLPQRGIVTLATNVPGPRHRLRIMGGKVAGLLPIAPIALRLRTGVAVLSYADELVFGITADYDGAADVELLAEGIGRAVARLAALSRDEVLLFPADREDPHRTGIRTA